MLRRTSPLLALLTMLTVAPLPAADKPAEPADLHGDLLPGGAVARLGSIRYRYGATAIACSPDGKLLAAGGADNRIRLLDPASGKVIRELAGHQPRTYNPP